MLLFFTQPVLFFMCMGNELFFCLLYIMYYIEEPQGEYHAINLFYCVAL